MHHINCNVVLHIMFLDAKSHWRPGGLTTNFNGAFRARGSINSGNQNIHTVDLELDEIMSPGRCLAEVKSEITCCLAKPYQNDGMKLKHDHGLDLVVVRGSMGP